MLHSSLAAPSVIYSVIECSDIRREKDTTGFTISPATGEPVIE